MKQEALDKSVTFIKSWLAYRYEHEETPGFVVAISHKGKIVMNEAYGFADLENNTKMTSNHIFRIASHSKSFTSTALMQLQEQGKLRIDDYVTDFLPWLKSHKDKRWQKITIRQIMSHGAGIVRDGNKADYWQLERPFPDKAQLKKEIMDASLVIDNNIKMKYSNYGYSLLGLLIEAVAGISYNKYVTKHIVKPLGLKNTGPEYTPELDDRLVTGYSRREADKKRLPIAHTETQAMAPATGFYATADDLCAYFTAHFVGSGQLLDDESKKEMQRVHFHAKTPGQENDEDYGLGLVIENLKKRTTVGHGGGFPGQITMTVADPKDELVVVVLTNCIGGPAENTAKGIYGIFDYFNDNMTSSKPKHDLAKFEGRFAGLWGVSEMVAVGDKLVSIHPGAWQPFSSLEELEYVDGKTLRVTNASSFSSEDELVVFNFDNNKIKSVNHTGSTLWPEEVWKKKQQSRKRVEL
ncbi:MAG: serine hydrolase domain-containing protein [Candidatus Saccharibacteria bacterium]|nr:serine hydrolase domain-containing protein [Candidatus Saccharibacteria bacterium]